MAVLSLLAVSGLLFKLTGLVAKPLVNHSIQSMMKMEADRRKDQPRVLVTIAGERIEAKRVLDQGNCWGITRKDGQVVVLKKEQVREVQMLADADTPK